MKRFVFLLLFVASGAFAAPISFNFTEVPLVSFAQSTFRNLLHVDYVIAPEVVVLDRRISLSVAAIEEARVFDFVKDILLQQGIAVDVRAGVYYLVLAKPISAPASPVLSSAADQALVVPGRVSAGLNPVHGLEGDAPVNVIRAADEDSEVYSPVNRSSDFLVSVLSVAFDKRSVVSAGGDVVLTGSKADLRKMRSLLESVDSVPKLVDVSASWVEVTNNAGDGRGISLLASVLGAKFGVSVGAVNSGSAISLKGSRFEFVLDALRTDGRFKQVSNSRVVGDDYEKLMLTVGDETPTIASTGKDNAGNTVQNIVYRPSGVIVDVLPKVLGNGRIQLALDGQISNFKSTVTGVVASPTLIKRQVKTKVTVEDGDVLLIGGLNDSQDTRNTSALSFWPSLSSRSSSSSQTDLVLILSAKVVKR